MLGIHFPVAKVIRAASDYQSLFHRISPTDSVLHHPLYSAALLTFVLVWLDFSHLEDFGLGSRGTVYKFPLLEVCLPS